MNVIKSWLMAACGAVLFTSLALSAVAQTLPREMWGKYCAVRARTCGDFDTVVVNDGPTFRVQNEHCRVHGLQRFQFAAEPYGGQRAYGVRFSCVTTGLTEPVSTIWIVHKNGDLQMDRGRTLRRIIPRAVLVRKDAKPRIPEVFHGRYAGNRRGCLSGSRSRDLVVTASGYRLDGGECKLVKTKGEISGDTLTMFYRFRCEEGGAVVEPKEIGEIGSVLEVPLLQNGSWGLLGDHLDISSGGESMSFYRCG